MKNTYSRLLPFTRTSTVQSTLQRLKPQMEIRQWTLRVQTSIVRFNSLLPKHFKTLWCLSHVHSAWWWIYFCVQGRYDYYNLSPKKKKKEPVQDFFIFIEVKKVSYQTDVQCCQEFKVAVDKLFHIYNGR